MSDELAHALTRAPRNVYRIEGGWYEAEKALAFALAVLIGSHLILTRQFAIAFVPAVALFAVWWPVVRSLRQARWTLLLGAAALANGLLLLWLNTTRSVSDLVAWNVCLELVGVLACAGSMTWVMRTIGVGPGGVAFALGMVINANPTGAFNSSDPLRFAYSLPIILLLLFAAAWLAKKPFEIAALVISAGFAALIGSRSVFGVAVMALVLMALTSHGGRNRIKLSMPSTIAALAGLAFAAYHIGQALLLEGMLGETARQRTEYQIRLSGELILGGRPEVAAATALIRDQIWGYGAGVKPSLADLQVARNSMAQIGYDPMNGYVENYMFGDVFRLHSMLGDMWAAFGIFGLLLVVYLCWHVIRVIQAGPHPGGADAAVLFLSFLMLWNALFAPWFSSLDIVILFLALAWTRTLSGTRNDDGST